MKKILLILFGLLFVSGAYSAQIANVEYVHKMIEQTWDITVPYNSALNSVKQIANMKYLLSAIDVANHMLNGSATTDYGNGEFATTQVANTDTVNTAVETLVTDNGGRNYKFFITTTSNTTSFKFYLSAAGEFYVDWGDGTRNKITRTNTQELEYSHNYSTAGTYTIKIGGQATAYTGEMTAAIGFSNINYSYFANNIASIDGSLGAIFGTLSSGTQKQPRFYGTFSGASNMTGSIPSDLFAGISGAPASGMFYRTFQGCGKLTSIPSDLFAGISGAPAGDMFFHTFSGCSGLTSIPAGLFAGISGKPAFAMFWATFYGCSGLTGAIPDGLFAGISGAPARDMFRETFSGCSGLTSIPENLFGNISGTAQSDMFKETFYNCTSLTGPSARINGQYLYEIWPSATTSQVDDMYYKATKLDDYRCIPTVWGGAGEDCSAPTPEFTLTTTSDTDVFAMKISAAGEFVVDWGDGTVETITKPDTTNTTYSHNYTTAGAYTIGIGGQATAYNTSATTATISFSSSASKIASIDGSLGAIFGTLSSDTNNQPRFNQTFYNATNMTGSIPSDLFAGISGAPASYMFSETFRACSGLTSIPSDLFAGISGAPAFLMFAGTFWGCSGLTGAIPDGLFAGISGAPASGMFSSTFKGCSGLTSIPENLFGNISGTAKTGMFLETFANCTSLTGPSARINGQYLYEIWPSATSQFSDMYKNATGLDDYRCIPTVWGGGGEDCSAPTAEFTLTTTSTNRFSFSISAAGEFVVDWGDGTVETITKANTKNTIYTHNYDTAGAYTIGIGGQATAYNTDEYTAAIGFVDAIDLEFDSAWQIASINGSLGAIFGTLSSDTNNQPRFYYTFYNATNMKGSIPSDLFAGISGAPASGMFAGTFFGCFGLTSIPENLFAGISGAPAERMFASTFSNCIGLTSIPSDLFAGISGAPASSMFSGTFSGCSGLTGAIPDGLFGNLSGAPAYGMFSGTFSGCSGLTSIPENLFGNISGTAQNYMFRRTFYNCTSLTGPSARINGQYLYEIWPSGTSDQVMDMYYNATGLDDYRCIPTVWGGGGEDCSAPTAEFTLTTTPDTSSFSFKISAAGEFVIDWGDGKRQTITKANTTNTTYSHNYDTAGAYTIGIGGQATAYNTGTDTAAISFSSSASKIASIDGSLGAIFGTLADGTQPRFYMTFYDAYNMKGSIPANLFAGISGAPASNMFSDTFSGCSGLTGAIPAGLFGNLTGAPAIGMFGNTFAYCSGLTGAIPDGLFAGISGAPASHMFSGTFNGCSGLTSIPDGLFAGISGAPASYMFTNTFSGCSGLTGAIPDGLFGNLTGAPASYMFSETFLDCSGLTSIPENLFGNISGTAQNFMFSNTFYNCTSLTGPSARINGQYLYEIWPDATSYQVGDMYSDATNLDDYSMIPFVWGGGKEEAYPPAPTDAEYKFFVSTEGDYFAIFLGAAGEFYVDWGDGKTQLITKTDTDQTLISHTYTEYGEYDIKIGGIATAYNSDGYTAAIAFTDNDLIQSIIYSMDGSLGAIFGTLADGTQPRFTNTFRSCGIYDGRIPENLFAGISGAPASNMFHATFAETGVTEIPENLFAGLDINEPLQEGTFYMTFLFCSSLTGPSARINGQYLYEIWPDATSDQIYGMYLFDEQLEDYENIPDEWKNF